MTTCNRSLHIPTLLAAFFPALFLLAGCSGGGGSEQGGRVGSDTDTRTIFQDLVVKGIRYQDGPRSSLSDLETGAIDLDTGANATFSLGDISFGSLEISNDSHFSDIFLSELPTTAEAIRREVGNPNNVSEFDRLINSVTLLIALDQDADASNGIDLAGLDELIVGSGVSIDQPMTGFIEDPKVLRLCHNYGTALPKSFVQTIVFLYEQLGIRVPSERIQRLSSTDTTESRSVVYSFDLESNIETRTENTHSVQSGQLTDGPVVTRYEWNEQYMVERADITDGTPSNATFSYTEQDKILTQNISGPSGQLNITNEYNELGQLLLRTTATIFNSTSTSSIERYTYNEVDQLATLEVNENDEVNSYRITEYSYNDSTMTSKLIRSGNDLLPQGVESKILETYIYNENGYTETITKDIGENGVVNEVTSYEYDTRGNVSAVYQDVNPLVADGIADTIVRLEYNEFGLLTRQTTDNDGDNLPETEQLYTFNDEGYLESATIRHYLNGDLTSTSQLLTNSYITFRDVDGLRNLIDPQQLKIPILN